MKKEKKCKHSGQAVTIGPYTVYAGGTTHLKPSDYLDYDTIIALEHRFILPPVFGKRLDIIMASIPDFHPPPKNWKNFLEIQVIPKLKEGKKILVFCIGGHGRTGTFLASLVALIEDRKETCDPIETIRRRYCQHAVETLEQAEAIFALRNEIPPQKYKQLFSLKHIGEAKKWVKK